MRHSTYISIVRLDMSSQVVALRHGAGASSAGRVDL